MKPAASRKISAPVQLTWSFLGRLYRATAWPDVLFEVQEGSTWSAFEPDPSDEIFASAAVMLGRAEWKRFLEFVPSRERTFLETFTWNRLGALAVLTRCPALASELMETPALTAFVAAHVALRGAGQPAWGEISAVYERSRLYGVLEWLGLPATRRAVEMLAELEDADIPRRLLSDLREALWSPAGLALVRLEPPRAPRSERRLQVAA